MKIDGIKILYQIFTVFSSVGISSHRLPSNLMPLPKVRKAEAPGTAACGSVLLVRCLHQSAYSAPMKADASMRVEGEVLT